jgi:tRNA G10  N-methylase Trm11
LIQKGLALEKRKLQMLDKDSEELSKQEVKALLQIKKVRYKEKIQVLKTELEELILYHNENQDTFDNTLNQVIG